MLIDDNFLDTIALDAKLSARLRMNRDMRNSTTDQSQRMINALEPNTILPIHRHRETSETQILIRGKIDVIYYNDKGDETHRFHLDSLHGTYGINIPAGQWHSLEVLESAIIFEAKDGPYTPLTPEDQITQSSISFNVR